MLAYENGLKSLVNHSQKAGFSRTLILFWGMYTRCIVIPLRPVAMSFLASSYISPQSRV